MDVIHLLCLAIIQGVSEFLPISSSAHLLLPSLLLGWPDQGLAFDVAVHLGSLSAVVIYFRKETQNLCAGGLAILGVDQYREHKSLALNIFVATLPIVIIGLLAKSFIENNLRDATVVALCTIVFGVALWWADRNQDKLEDAQGPSLKHAFIIGCAQTLALMPGTSRSGITITAALLLGYTRNMAARFSFLLSIPAILGAAVLLSFELINQEKAIPWIDLAVASIASAISAFFCIHVFLLLLDRIGFTPFVLYRIALGFLILVMVY